MIQEFRLDNFFSFSNEEVLTFEASTDKEYESQYCVEVKSGLKLLKLGVIYGANASGKTNILKGLDFVRNFILKQKSNKSVQTDFIPFLLNPENEEKPGKLYLSFFINEYKYIYTLTINKEVVLEENLSYYPSTQPASVFERYYDEESEKSIIKFGKKINLTKNEKNLVEGITISNSSVLSSYSKTNTSKTILDDVYEWFENNFMKIVKPKTDLFGFTSNRIEDNTDCKEFVLEVLQKADFNISSIEIEEEEISIDEELKTKILNSDIPKDIQNEFIQKGKIKAKDLSFTHKADNFEKKFPRNLESSGTMRYYGLGGILNKLLKSNNFLMIDELENSLHYDLVSHFIKTFLMNSTNSQLLCTTHDINLLNEDFIRRDTVWFTEKNEKGSTQINSLLDFKLHKNLSPFNAYKIGKLGAKPNLGDIIISDYEAK